MGDIFVYGRCFPLWLEWMERNEKRFTHIGRFPRRRVFGIRTTGDEGVKDEYLKDIVGIIE